MLGDSVCSSAAFAGRSNPGFGLHIGRHVSLCPPFTDTSATSYTESFDPLFDSNHQFKHVDSGFLYNINTAKGKPAIAQKTHTVPCFAKKKTRTTKQILLLHAGSHSLLSQVRKKRETNRKQDVSHPNIDWGKGTI